MTPREKEQLDVGLVTAAAEKNIKAYQVLFESACQIGNETLAQEFLDKIHTTMDVYLDGIAFKYFAARKEAYKTDKDQDGSVLV